MRGLSFCAGAIIAWCILIGVPTVRPVTVPVAPSASPTDLPADAPSMGESVPLTLAGDVGFNVRAALDASNGALRTVTIAPGATWSFNATVGDPAYVTVRSINGIAGGGWCDLASRYVQALRPLLPPEAIRFPNHLAVTNGIRLADVADADAVSIWNIGGQAGNAGGAQDLQITNTLSTPLHIRVEETADGRSLVVRAFVQR